MASEDPQLPRSPGLATLRGLLLVTSALVGLSAIWAAWDAVATEPRVWGWLGFEVVTLVAAGLGVMVGLGKPMETPALGAACIAGTVFAASTLGRFSAIVTRVTDAGSEAAAVRMLARDPFYLSRLLAVLALVVVTLGLALGADRRAWKLLGLGLLSGIPVIGAAAWVTGPGQGVLLAPVESAAGVARLVASVLGALALVVLASMSVHLTIRAFESRMGPLPGESAGSERKAAARVPNNPA
jgi:hypothetical protein